MGRPKRYGSVAEKQKAYRERKRIQGGVKVERFEFVAGSSPADGNSGFDSPPAYKPTISELRELIEQEHAKPVEAAVVPLVYRDDFGRVISERQWKTLQERKRRASESGYVIDEWAQ
jgi:hypothetical protein